MLQKAQLQYDLLQIAQLQYDLLQMAQLQYAKWWIRNARLVYCNAPDQLEKCRANCRKIKYNVTRDMLQINLSFSGHPVKEVFFLLWWSH